MATRDAGTSMIDESTDCTGRTRRFKLEEYADGRFLDAQEIRVHDERGLRFVMPAGPDGVAPWGELRQRIRRRLALRHVVRGATGKLEILADVIRGQLDEAGPDEVGPGVVVDDLRLRWEEVGELLAANVGFGVRIEITEPGDE